jgi:hypothetical protein
MATLRDSGQETARELHGYRNMTAAVLAINAASAATFKTTNAYVYLSDGLFKAKTALAAQAFTAGHAVQAIGQTMYYAVGLDSAGAVTTYQGAPASAAAISAALANGQSATSVPGSVPDVPNGITAVGLIKVVTTSAAFTPGTTALDAAGITVTFYDIALLPSAAP